MRLYGEKEKGSNQLIDKRSNSNGPKAASKGLSNESTKKRGEATRSNKDCENVGGRYQWHVQHLGKVTYQVAIKTSYCKSITEFICCIYAH